MIKWLKKHLARWAQSDLRDANYDKLYDDYFQELLAGCALKQEWDTPYLSPLDQVSPSLMINDAKNSQLCKRDDVEMHAKLQKDVEGASILCGIDFKPLRTWLIPKYKIPSGRGNRFVWVRFMRSFVDLDTGEETSVYIGSVES